MKYANLNELLKTETDARQYYDTLPRYIRSQISTRPDGVNSFQSLQSYAENLLRGDN